MKSELIRDDSGRVVGLDMDDDRWKTLSGDTWGAAVDAAADWVENEFNELSIDDYANALSIVLSLSLEDNLKLADKIVDRVRLLGAKGFIANSGGA